MSDNTPDLIRNLEEYAARLEDRETLLRMLSWVDAQEKDNKWQIIEGCDLPEAFVEIQKAACKKIGVPLENAVRPEKKQIRHAPQPVYVDSASHYLPSHDSRPILDKKIYFWLPAAVVTLILTALAVFKIKLIGWYIGLVPLGFSIYFITELYECVSIYNIQKSTWETKWRFYNSKKKEQDEEYERNMAEWSRERQDVIAYNKEVEEYNQTVFPEKLHKYCEVVATEKVIIKERLNKAEVTLSAYGDLVPEAYRDSATVRGIAEILAEGRVKTVEAAAEISRIKQEMLNAYSNDTDDDADYTDDDADYDSIDDDYNLAADDWMPSNEIGDFV